MSDTAFERAFAKLHGIEGGYVNDKTDRGGATRFGITEGVARENGYTGDMGSLPVEVASRIYRSKYWDKLRLDQVSLMSYMIADELFDTCVNMGTEIAGRFLQSALNAFNRNGKDFPDISIDGEVGPGTIGTLRKFLDLRGTDGEKVLFRALNAQQGARYLEIARNDQTQEKFVFGWFLQRVS